MHRRKFGEDLAVECETGLLQFRYEGGVGLVTILADSSVQADYPELAEVSLLVAAMGEGVASGAHERFVRSVQFLGTNAAIAFSPVEDIFAALIRHYSAFDSCHTKMITVLKLRARAREKASTNLDGQVDGDRTAFTASL